MRGNEIMERELQEVDLYPSLQKVSYPYFQGVFPMPLQVYENEGVTSVLITFAFYSLFYMFPHFPTLPLFISFGGIR